MGLLSKLNISELPEQISESSTDFDPNEIWTYGLGYGEEGELIILDEGSAPCIDAVELYRPGGRVKRAAVLVNDGRDCPFTNLYEETGNKKFKPKKFFVFTVLDLREYVKKDGTVIPYTKKALLVKAHTMDKFFRKNLLKVQERNNGTFQGAKFEASRGPDMQPKPAAIGEQWQFLEMVDLDEFEDTEVYTEEQILSLFITDSDELSGLAEEWSGFFEEAAAAPKAKY